MSFSCLFVANFSSFRVIFLTQFLDAFDKILCVFDRRFRRDAVSEIKNMSGVFAVTLQNPFGFFADFLFRREQNRRIEIALQTLFCRRFPREPFPVPLTNQRRARRISNLPNLYTNSRLSQKR